MLTEAFETKEFWRLRMAWLRSVFDGIITQQWNAERAAAISVAPTFSQRGMDKLRSMTSRRYSADIARHMPICLVSNPHLTTDHITLPNVFVPPSNGTHTSTC
eukprot:6211845-Pleurochrysis_carterae.AAC.1